LAAEAAGAAVVAVHQVAALPAIGRRSE
jgi:hypothetical protein